MVILFSNSDSRFIFSGLINGMTHIYSDVSKFVPVKVNAALKMSK
ncbi:hypothetical protein [Lactobacillus kullabergensis]